MTTFTASVRVDDDTLHTSRPITAPEKVGDLIDTLIYAVTSGEAGEVTSAELTIETSGESDTPIADSVSGTSSTPLAAPADPDEDEA